MKISSQPKPVSRRDNATQTILAILVLGILSPMASLAAERTAPAAAEDLLARPLDALWRHYSEEAQTKLPEVWQVRDGVLVCRGTPKGYLYLDRKLTNFILRLEWRWPAGKKPGNGGVLVRTTGPDQIWPRSLEAQLNAGQAGDFWGLIGYSLDGPTDRKQTLDHDQFGRLTHVKRSADLEKPAGVWNRYEIIAQGAEVTLIVNGQEANRATQCEVIAGRICLTAEGDEIHFRNVRLISKDD